MDEACIFKFKYGSECNEKMPVLRVVEHHEYTLQVRHMEMVCM